MVSSPPSRSTTAVLALVGLAALVVGLRPAVEELRLLHPIDGAVYPPNIAPPTWTWQAGEAPWSVDVALGDSAFEEVAVVSEPLYRPPDAVWGRTKAQLDGGNARVRVRSSDGQSQQASFRISEHPLTGTLVFRLVRAPIGSDPLLRTQLRRHHTGEGRSSPLDDALGPTPCKGCHVISAKGDRVAYQVRDPYDGPRLETLTVGAETRHAPDLPQNAFGRSAGLAWTPDGQLVVAMNQRASEERHAEGFSLTHHASDLALVDPDTGQWTSIAGASDPAAVEDFPDVSPDGATLAFTRGPEIHTDRGPMDVCTVPLTDGYAGTARPLPGASANGRANYFPRFSPDGRWIAYVTSDGGYLARPSSDVMLVPAAGGEARPLAGNSPGRMDSWPTWSLDGHWLAWASRRATSGFTRILLAEIDAQGRSSSPVPLPTDTSPIWSHNHPTFAPE